ncbi:MAG: hypothetical protein AAGB06_00495 [Verrucomicrobiota bacterium]
MPKASDSKTNSRKKRPLPWLVTKRGIFIPLSLIVSVLSAVSILLVLVSIGPSDRSIPIILSYILFPVIAGILLVHCMCHRKPWRIMLYQFLTTIVFCTASYFIIDARWS